MHADECIIRHRLRDDFPACAGRHVHLGQPRHPVLQRGAGVDVRLRLRRSWTASPSRCCIRPMDEFLRTGDRIIPIMNAKGRYSDERIMRRADGELFWCHVTGRALDPPAAAGRRRLDLRGRQRKAPGHGRADPARTRDRRPAGRRQDQQGDRARDRPVAAHGGDAPRQADAEILGVDLVGAGAQAGRRECTSAQACAPTAPAHRRVTAPSCRRRP